MWKEKLFLLISGVNILAAIGITLYRLVDVVKNNPSDKDFAFTVLLIVNAGTQYWY